jgi:hypothetical protein
MEGKRGYVILNMRSEGLTKTTVLSPVICVIIMSESDTWRSHGSGYVFTIVQQFSSKDKKGKA